MAGESRGGQQVVPRPGVWQLGPPAPWPAEPHDGRRCDPLASVANLVEALADRAVSTPLIPAFDGARNSAVLVLLADGPGGAEVLLTKRSMHLRHHRGEISFPGGRMDAGETPLETAIREADEEVGLSAELVTPVCELDHLNTVVSRSYIVPQVAICAGRPLLAPASVEVDRVWWQPLGELLEAPTYRAEVWGAPPTDRLLHFFELPGETIWGATAHMLVDLLTTVLQPRHR